MINQTTPGNTGRTKPRQPGAPAPAPVTDVQGQPQPAMPASAPVQRPAAPQGLTAGQMQGSVDQRLADIRAQLAQAEVQARAARSMAPPRAPGWASDSQVSQQLQRQGAAWSATQNAAGLRRQLDRETREAEGQALRDSELARRDQVREEIFGGARGRVDELRADPTDQLILQQLTQRVQGGGPFTDEVVRGLFSQQGDMAAAAERQALSRVQGRPGDPAFEARRQAITSDRQGGLNNAMRDLRIRQLLGNYDAGTRDLGQLAGFNQGRNAQITEAERNLQGLLTQETFNFGDEEPGYQDFLRLLRRRG